MGLERWLPPRAFVLGVFLSALFLSFLLPVFLVFAYRVFYNRICLSFFLRPVVGAVRFLSSLSFVVCSCLLLLLMSWGGFLLLRGWSCMLRCLCLFFCFALLQRKPERCPLVQTLLASSSRCPVLLLLVHMYVAVVCVCCVDARARVATANFRLKLTVLLRRSPGDSSPSARLLLALCSSSPHLCPHG